MHDVSQKEGCTKLFIDGVNPVSQQRIIFLTELDCINIFSAFDSLDDRGKPPSPPQSKTPELEKSHPISTEAASSDTNTTAHKHPLKSEAENTPLNTIPTLLPSAPVADVMDAPPPPKDPTQPFHSPPEVPAYPAPLPDPVPTSAAQIKQTQTDKKATEAKEEMAKEIDTKAEEMPASIDATPAPSSTTNGVAEVEPEKPTVILPPTHLEASLESPIAQPEELCLPNGLPLPAPQDPEVPGISIAERDDSPIAEPDISEQPVTQTSTNIPQSEPMLAVHATSAPADQAAPAPTVHEGPVEPVMPTAAAQPEVLDAVPAVTMDVKEDVPVPQPSAKEEAPLPAEIVSPADSAPETVPPTPPPSALEREDTPPPPTVTPALVETAMQGQSFTLTCIIK